MPRNTFYDGAAGDSVTIDTRVAQASTSATAAAASETAAATSETAAATSATASAASYDSFDDRYLGAKSSAPTVDNDGDALVDGALYWNTSSDRMFSWDGSAFVGIKPTSGEQTNINTVAADATDIGAVAGKATEIGRLGTSDAVADMAILGTTAIVADMAILATSDIVADMAILGTADVVSDMNTLATSDIIADLNTLATSDIVTDMSILATADIVEDMSILGTSANVTAMGLLGNSATVTDMGILGTAAIVEDMSILGTADNVTNMNTVADNISSVNSFAAQYRVASSAPVSSLDEGDLYFNTTDNKLYFYNGSAWTEVATYTHPNHSGDVTSSGDGALTIANGAVDTAHLAVDSVNGDKIADLSINSEHFVLGSIDANHIATDAVNGDKIADLSINSEHYINASIDNAHLAVNSVDSDNYVDGSIGNAHLADDAVDSDELAAGAVDIAHLSATGTAGSSNFLRGDNSWVTPTDTNTTYTAGTGITLSGTEFSAAPLALTTVQTAANQSAHLALTTQEGDVVVRSDENKTYVHNGGTASAMADFTLLATPTDAVTSVAGNTGVVTNAHIAAAVEAASDSNTFTDADHSKLDGVAASANNYTHPTSAGNVHIPAGGSAGQILRYASAGTAAWGADENDAVAMAIALG